MSENHESEFFIVSQDLEDEISIQIEKGKDSEFDPLNNNRETPTMPTLEAITRLIKAGERGVAKAAVIEAISQENGYNIGIGRLIDAYEVEKRHLLYFEMLIEGEVNYAYLEGYLERVAREYMKSRERNVASIEMAVGGLFEQIGTEKEEEIIQVMRNISFRYYSINPVKVRDICLSFFRTMAALNPHIAKSYFSLLKKNMTDDRILRSVINEARKEGDLVLAHECAGQLQDEEWGLYIIQNITSEILSIIVEKGFDGLHGVGGYSKLQEERGSKLVKILEILAVHSLKISEDLDEIIGGEDTSDSEILQSLNEWHCGLGEEIDLIGSNDEGTGEFTKDICEMPLFRVPRLISQHHNEVGSEEFILEIEDVVSRVRSNDLRRVREIIFHSLDSLVTKNPGLAIEMVNRLGIKNEDERVARRIAMAYESIGDYESAIGITNESDNTRTKALFAGILQRKRYLEEGYNLDYFEENTNFSPKDGRVIYLAHSSLPFVTSGYTIRTHNIVKELVKNEVDISVRTRWGFPGDRTDMEDLGQINNSQIIDEVKYNFDSDFGGFREFKMEDYTIRCADSIMNEAVKEGASLIHSASDHSIGIAAAMVSKSLGIPFIYEMRGIWALSRAANNPQFRFDPRFRILMKLEKQCAEAADVVVTLSEGMRGLLIDWGIEGRKIVVIPNGASAEMFSPIERDNNLASELGLNGQIVFGYIGSIVPYEGLRDLIIAIGMIPKRVRKRIKIVIVGDGTDRESLENLVEEADLGGNFVFTGKVKHEEIANYYSIIDAIIVPRSSEEVCELVPPLKPLEAMAMSKPVICSDVAPAVELIRGNFNGVLFRKDDPSSLADVVVDVTSNFEKYRKIGEKSREWVKKNRKWDVLADRIGDIYLMLRMSKLASHRTHRVKEISDLAIELIEGDKEGGFQRLCSITDKIELSSKNRTARNVFLGILRAYGYCNLTLAIEYGELFIGKLGDKRSVKSMTTFYKRMGIKEIAQFSRIGERLPELSDEIEDIIVKENRKIRIRESPYLQELSISDLLGSGIEEEHIFAISGTILCSEEESVSAALIQFDFLDSEGVVIDGAPGLLSNSKSVGWYSYLNQNMDDGSFNVEFIPPTGTKKILAGVRTWNNSGRIHMLPDLDVRRSSMDQIKEEILEFSEMVKKSESESVVFMFSGTTFVQELRANRPIRLTTEMVNRGIPVIFNYHRWNRREEIPEKNGNLIQIPIDVTERILGDIAELDFGGKKKIFIVSYPHPSIGKILNRFRALGWITFYDARDEWEEFEKVGQAKWFKTWNEKYIVHNVEHVTSVSWPLAEKLDRFSPSRKVEVLPNALSPNFLSDNYEWNGEGTGKIGYFGHLTGSWFDWDSLIKIAKLRPQYEFEIIGHSEPEGLKLPGNISLLGPKTHSEINKIADKWEIAIIPFKIGKLSDAVDPIKIYEYLALGLPTVSFRMPQIDSYPYTKTVDGTKEFCEALDYFIGEEVSQRLIWEWLETNTWGDRVDRILELSEHKCEDGITSIGE